MSDQIPMTRRAALICAGASIFLLGNAKGLPNDGLKRGERGRVIRIVDGDSFVMETSDGELTVRLSAIQAPRTNLRAKSAWPFAREATAALGGLIANRDVQLSYGDVERDRFGRAVAQVHTMTPEGRSDLWVQGEIVRLGLARVYSWRGETADMVELYRLEEQARKRRRAIWSDQFYAVRSPDPDPLAQYVDSLQIVEGIVTSTAEVRGRIYLNFGADYRTDFTVAIARKNARNFEALDPISLTGARVRVRGWIELINGPMIWMDHPGRLEILS